MDNKVFILLASGPSLNQEDCDYIRGKGTVIAISDSYRLAPWADMLASHDTAWWKHHKEAYEFAGRKFCAQGGTRAHHYRPDGLPVACNSGLYAMHIAKSMGAELIILLGFDMQGTHFFGAHPAGLKNTDAKRFAVHRAQFRNWRGVEVINCTVNSALQKFPIQLLRKTI